MRGQPKLNLVAWTGVDGFLDAADGPRRAIEQAEPGLDRVEHVVLPDGRSEEGGQGIDDADEQDAFDRARKRREVECASVVFFPAEGAPNVNFQTSRTIAVELTLTSKMSPKTPPSSRGSTKIA